MDNRSPNRSRHRPIRQADRGQTTTNSSSATSNFENNSIPGFYYDTERRRYFKILPNHLGAGTSGSITSESLREKDTEAKRQKLIECGGKEIKKSKHAAGLLSMVMKQELGFIMNRDRVFRQVAETMVRNFDIKSHKTFDLFPSYPASISMMNCTEDGRQICACGKIYDSNQYCAISLTDIPINCANFRMKNGIPNRIHPESYSCTTMRGTMADMCVACVRNEGTLLLFVKNPADFNGKGEVVMIRNYPDGDQPRLLRSIGRWTIAGEASSCAWDKAHDRASIGSRNAIALLVFGSAAELPPFIQTEQKEPMVQRFSQDGNSLFVGLRAHDGVCYDIRSKEKVLTWAQSNVCGLHLLADENYLLAGNLHGQIKMWDVRMQRCVRTFDGHVNTHTKLPLIVNEMDSLVIAGGEDGTTRCWSLQTAELLRQIPSPRPIGSRLDMPAVCYSTCWGGIPGNPGLVLGVGDRHSDVRFFNLQSQMTS